jgi:hypothetical protein
MTKVIELFKGTKNCSTEDLDAFFRVIKAHIDNDDVEGAIVVDSIEPIIQRFIEEFYDDLEPLHIMTFFWVWYIQWCDKRGDWDGVPSSAA